MSENRKCIVKREYQSDLEGTFHQWAQKAIYANDNEQIAVTYGLVELDNGQMFEATPTSIKFLDK